MSYLSIKARHTAEVDFLVVVTGHKPSPEHVLVTHSAYFTTVR